jgi:hypothetical protein
MFYNRHDIILYSSQKEKGQKQAMIKSYNVNIDFLSAHDTFLA